MKSRYILLSCLFLVPGAAFAQPNAIVAPLGDSGAFLVDTINMTTSLFVGGNAPGGSNSRNNAPGTGLVGRGDLTADMLRGLGEELNGSLTENQDLFGNNFGTAIPGLLAQSINSGSRLLTDGLNGGGTLPGLGSVNASTGILADAIENYANTELQGRHAPGGGNPDNNGAGLGLLGRADITADQLRGLGRELDDGITENGGLAGNNFGTGITGLLVNRIRAGAQLLSAPAGSTDALNALPQQVDDLLTNTDAQFGSALSDTFDTAAEQTIAVNAVASGALTDGALQLADAIRQGQAPSGSGDGPGTPIAQVGEILNTNATSSGNALGNQLEDGFDLAAQQFIDFTTVYTGFIQQGGDAAAAAAGSVQ